VLIWAINLLQSKENDLRELEVEAEAKKVFALSTNGKNFLGLILKYNKQIK
jgi:hypothetical protein